MKEMTDLATMRMLLEKRKDTQLESLKRVLENYREEIEYLRLQNARLAEELRRERKKSERARRVLGHVLGNRQE